MAGTRRLRSYFENFFSYLGIQADGLVSIGMILDIDDTASESTQGFAKKSTDANAIARYNGAGSGDNFTRFVKPSQIPELILEEGLSHTPTTPVLEIGALKVTPLTYDDGSDVREDWKVEIVTGTPTSIVNASELDVLGIDNADNNGIFLQADSTEFEESSNKLSLAAGGITLDKLDPGNVNTVAVFGTAGVLESGTATKAQVDALAAIGNSKVLVTDGSGTVIAHATLSITELDVLDGAIAGTAVAEKALILDASKKIDEIDPTVLKVGGTTITATPVEINKLDGVANGIASANKALILGASKKIDELDIDGTFKIGGGTVTSSATELNLMDGVTVSTVELNKTAYLSTVTSDVQTQIDGVYADSAVDRRTADVTLTNNSNRRQAIDVSSASVVVDLPLASSVPAGFTFFIGFQWYGAGVFSLTIQVQGADHIWTLDGRSATSRVYTANTDPIATYTFISDGVSYWNQM